MFYYLCMQTPQNEYYAILKSGHGNHSKVARFLGITPEHYRRVRRTGKISSLLARAIVLEAERLGAEPHDRPSAPLG
jgi:hypothetical protein